MAEHLHWSLIFWVNVPLGLGAALLTNIYLKNIPRHDRRHKLDVLGAGLMMASCIPLLLALTWGGTRYGWLSPPILMLIGASFVLSLLFGWRLSRAAEPFLPLTVLNNPVMRTGTASASLSMGVQIGLTIVVPMYFEVVFHSERDRIRHRAHSDRADHARLAPVRPGHAVLEALQARAGRSGFAARWWRSCS